MLEDTPSPTPGNASDSFELRVGFSMTFPDVNFEEMDDKDKQYGYCAAIVPWPCRALLGIAILRSKGRHEIPADAVPIRSNSTCTC